MRNNDDKIGGPVQNNSYQSPVNKLFGKFTDHRDVTLVYGEPVIREDKAIVPVAKMKYAFGGGGGYSNRSDSGDGAETGEGGGGRFSVRPVGVYEMRNDRVRFKPVVDLKSILTIFSVLTLGMTFLLRRK